MSATNKTRGFNPANFLATIGDGRKALAVSKKRVIFSQGDRADAVFYIQKGKVRLSVVSKIGKEATIGILGEKSFFGEGSLAGQSCRMGSAVALTDCQLLRIEKAAMMDALHREHVVFGPVRCLSAGAQYPVRGRPSRSVCSIPVKRGWHEFC